MTAPTDVGDVLDPGLATGPLAALLRPAREHWDDLGADPAVDLVAARVAAPLLAALTARGYAEPTAVQAAVLQPEAAGRDLLVSAQTGSGKTVAYGLALAPELLGEAGRLPPAGAASREAATSPAAKG